MIDTIAKAEARTGEFWHEMWMRRGQRLIRIATDLEEMTRQRNILAKRCAEQAHEIAALRSPKPIEPTPTVFDAIAVLQSQGIR